MRTRRKIIGGSLAGVLFICGALAGWLLAQSRVPRITSHAITQSNQPSSERKVLYWYDAMNPSFHSDKPGKAPDGMDLVPKYADEIQTPQNMAPGTVMISPRWQQLIGVRTGKVERKRLIRTIRTVGLVVPDETKIARVHVKVAGWVDKVFVDFTGKLVNKNQPLFSLYSPDLLSTEQEYLIARKGEQYLGKSPYAEVAEGAGSLLQATQQRLRLWDVSEAQIEKLAETGKVSRTLTLYSPISGFVMKRNLYEQTYVTPETELYEIADLSTIWVDADVYEYEVPYVHVGLSATMQLDYFPGKTYTGRVSYVYPTLDPKTRTVKVRLEFPNPGFELKPDMYANVELSVDYGVQTVVPAEAVLDSGTRQIVFLAKPDGHFEPREVEVGPQFDDRYLILRGLKPGDTIVTSGNFLIDSESQMQAAMGAMAAPSAPIATAKGTQPQAQIQFSTEPWPPAKGTNVLRVQLTDAHGGGIAGAIVQVVFFLPGMPSMGMPPVRLASNLTDAGGGNYQGECNLTSGGAWQVTLSAQRNGRAIATRQLPVTVTGGI